MLSLPKTGAAKKKTVAVVSKIHVRDHWHTFFWGGDLGGSLINFREGKKNIEGFGETRALFLGSKGTKTPLDLKLRPEDQWSCKCIRYLSLVKHKTYKTWKIYGKEMTLTFNTHIPS